MDKHKDQLETLREIRSLMERSSRFLSLSGFTGVIAGLSAIIGVAAAYYYLDFSFNEPLDYYFVDGVGTKSATDVITFLVADVTIVLVISLLAAIMLTSKRAKQLKVPVWDATAKRLLINLLIPLIVGGLFCLALVYHGYWALIAPATLIFYGLALINASKYTLNDVRYLGMMEIITGLVAAVMIEYGLLLWAIGFGALHIVYGISMYYKYEK